MPIAVEHYQDRPGYVPDCRIIFKVYLVYLGLYLSKSLSTFIELYLLEMYIIYMHKAIFIILKFCYMCYEFIFILELHFKMI